ncbi:MFS transporter [Brevibacterium sp. BRM-1]|uniref:MFS transporter n=1 Tax=Brevibacterium sp. BRM-1 TaxID=2999062 RepID=UPI00227F0F77|nr:MFS transporter [Brevibacterium sp. BRM-1]WAL39306.1 MFS transporter [Brevibacterium sp. BRM-1]
MTTSSPSSSPSLLHQPRAVWAVAFACVIAFMGIGLVDPILPAISASLHASPAQSMLLFTSYLFITAITMFFSSFVSSRIGSKATLLIGLALIVVFAALAGASGSVGQVIGYRAGWGLGNALFISTALSTIVGAASGGSERAIILYEAALGVGIATGPLLGGLLGGISWRGPFFGTAALMAIGFAAIVVLLRGEAGARPERVRLSATLRALGHPGILALSIAALLYNFGFFTLLAYTPFPLEAAAKEAGIEGFGAHQLGLIFFGWGMCLALTSVLGSPWLTRRFGHLKVLAGALTATAAILAAMIFAVHSMPALIVCVVLAGLPLGIVNTAMTETVMEASELPRPVASATYSGVRFFGGALSPLVAGQVALAGAGMPYLLGAATVLIAAVVLVCCRRFVARVDARAEREAAAEAELTEAYAVTGGDA